MPSREAWRPFEIEVDGARQPFERLEQGGDWIAVGDLNDTECVYVHVEQPDGSPISIATITDITAYLDANAS